MFSRRSLSTYSGSLKEIDVVDRNIQLPAIFSGVTGFVTACFRLVPPGLLFLYSESWQRAVS
jgi:hypothetical protein